MYHASHFVRISQWISLVRSDKTHLCAGTCHHHRRRGSGRLRPVQDGGVDIGCLQDFDLHAAEERYDSDRDHRGQCEDITHLQWRNSKTSQKSYFLRHLSNSTWILQVGNTTSCDFPSDEFHAEYVGVDLSSWTMEETKSTKMRIGDTNRHRICQYGPGLKWFV